MAKSIQAAIRRGQMSQPERPVSPVTPTIDFRFVTGRGLAAKDFQHPQYERMASNPANWVRTPAGKSLIPIGNVNMSGVSSMAGAAEPSRFKRNAETIDLIYGNPPHSKPRGMPSDPVENFAAMQALAPHVKTAINRTGPAHRQVILDRILTNTSDWGPEAGPPLPRDASGYVPQKEKADIEHRVAAMKTEVAAERAITGLMKPSAGIYRPPSGTRTSTVRHRRASKVKTTFDPMIVPQEIRPSARVEALKKGRIDATTFIGGSLNLGLLGGRGMTR